MNKHAFVRRQGIRSSALLSVAALATTGLIAAAAPAGAALTQGGDDATTGAPGYFADSEGVALQLCLDACVEADAGEVADPAHAPYFIAGASLGGVDVEWGIESIEVVDEETEQPTGEIDAVNFLRVRGRDVLREGARYVLQGPWGRHTFTADGNTNTIVAESGGEAGSPLNGPVQSFLRPLNMSGDMLGDGHVFGRVTGSPTGFNRVTLTGPGLNARTARFALMGQLRAETPMSTLSTSSLKLGSITTSAASTKAIRVDSFGTADVNVSYTKSGANPGAFQVTDNCAGGDCNVTVSYTPRANRNVSAILTIDDGGLAAPRQVKLTGIAHDTLKPKVASSNVARGADNVRPGKSVKVRFSEAVRGFKSGLMLVDASGDKVAARVTRVRRTDTYKVNPRQALDGDATYMVKVNGGRNGIRDFAGNAAKDVQWKFRTR